MAKTSKAKVALPAMIVEEISTLGANISIARKRRRMSRRELAERMMVNPKTVQRMEAGDPNLGIGILATALWVLGLQRRLGELVSPQTDQIGLQAELHQLPSIIRTTKTQADEFNF